MLIHDQIAQGEELLKASTPAPWVWKRTKDDKGWLGEVIVMPNGAHWSFTDVPEDTIIERQDDLCIEPEGELVVFLVNNASELLQAAKEVAETKEHILRYMSDNRRDIQCICAVKSPSCGCVNDDYNKALDDVEKFIKEELT